MSYSQYFSFFQLNRGCSWNNRSAWFAYKWRVHTKIRMQAETCYRKSIICILVRDLNKLFQSKASAFPHCFFWLFIYRWSKRRESSEDNFIAFPYARKRFSRLSGCYQLNRCWSQLICVIFYFVLFHHFCISHPSTFPPIHDETFNYSTVSQVQVTFTLIFLFRLFNSARYHEDRMINYDHEDGVSVSSKLTSSILTVRNATARHGGK